MTSYQIDLINPNAGKLLQDLADMNLIAIRGRSDVQDGFMKVVEELRASAARLPPISEEEIAIEVEAVRAELYAKRKG